MEPGSPSPYPQMPSTCPYPEPSPSSPHDPLQRPAKIHLNIIIPSTSWSPQWPLSLRLPHQHPVHTSILPIRATCPAHLIRLDFTTHTILGKEYRSLLQNVPKAQFSLSGEAKNERKNLQSGKNCMVLNLHKHMPGSERYW
jgi:hypothetical protein